MKSREGFNLNQEDETTPEAQKMEIVKRWAIRHAAEEVLEAR